jgi:hypothetical protein
MKRGGILLSGDWQGAWSNIDRLRQFQKWFLETAVSLRVKQVVLTGDLKEALNPVDVRVANNIVNCLEVLADATGIAPIVLLGNHDRTGMQDDSGDWFPLLKAAGAVTITEPMTVRAGAWRFHGVPYYGNHETSRKAFEILARGADPSDSILLFHTTLSGTQLNWARAATSVLRPVDLHPKKYAWCMGGHIHLFQSLGRNVQYVGSPFCQDWGEANQKKGAVYIEPDLKATHFLESPNARYCDPTIPGFQEPPGGWQNSILRLRVPESEEAKAIAKANRLYPGATLVIKRPAVSDMETLASPIGTQGADPDLIQSYLQAKGVSDAGRMEAYLLAKLGQVPGAAGSFGFSLDKLQARNVLSFRRVTVDYRVPGLNVVRGRNGAGKTNYLQLPLVLFFGKTLKGQQHNDWVCQNPKGSKSYIRGTVTLPDGRVVTITRRRKPHPALRLEVDGANISTGFGANDTQRRLESLLGITWDSVVNAMYIDQSELNLLLVGTDQERRSLFSHLLGLNRFTLANKLVRKDLQKVTRELQVVPSEISGTVALIEQMGVAYKQLEATALPITQEELKATRSLRKVTQEKAAFLLKRANKRKLLFNKTSGLCADLQVEVAHKYGGYSILRSKIAEARKSKKCPTCGAVLSGPVDTSGQEKELEQMKAKLANLRKTLENLKELEEVHRGRWRSAQSAADRVVDEHTDMERLEQEQSRRMATYTSLQETLQENKTQIAHQIRRLRILTQYQKDLTADQEFLKFAEGVLGRNGLPAHLLATTCPVLNKATSMYSDLFSEGTIQVKFSASDTDLDVQVQNSQGGKYTKDQSCGELRVASLITSFAVRQVLSRFNVLTADEPGNGLDEFNSGVFAKALERISDRFGRILLTSHNPFILQALDTAPQITVTKKNRISTVEFKA